MAKGCTTLQVGSTHYGNMTADRRPWQVHLETKGRQYDKTFTIALKRNGGAPFGGWRHHLSPSSRGHYGRWAFLPIGGYIRIARRAIHNPQRPKAAVKPKNPPARKGRSILRTFLYNPSAQSAAKPRPFAPQGRVLLHSGPRRALCTILPAYHSIQAGYYSAL